MNGRNADAWVRVLTNFVAVSEEEFLVLTN